MNPVVLPESALELITRLGLQPLNQEGGFFRRSAEAQLWVTPDSPSSQKCRAYSVIYSLLTAESFSALHVLAKDEIWCWHAGDVLESLRLYPDGRGEWVQLGNDVIQGQRPQDIVAAGVVQGTRVAAGGAWALASCVVAPEFFWEDFSLANRDELLAKYPEFRDDIRSLTRDEPAAGEL